MNQPETMIQIATILIVIGLPVICGTIVVLVKIFHGGGGKRQRETEAEEARLIQQMHRDLTRLEERMESMETIVLERDHHKGERL